MKWILAIAIMFPCSGLVLGQEAVFHSPDQQVEVRLTAGDSLRFSIRYQGKVLIEPSTLGLHTSQFSALTGSQISFRKPVVREVRNSLLNPVPYKRKVIADHFTEVQVRGKGPWSLMLRIYNDGVAYRFGLHLPDSARIHQEIAHYRPGSDARVWYADQQYREGQDVYHTSFEDNYAVKPLDSLPVGRLTYTPVLLKIKNTNLFITDAAVDNYPGMHLTLGKTLHARFPAYPAKEEIQGGEFKQRIVTARENYLARVKGNEWLPWRVFGIAGDDKALLGNDLVYRLGTPAENRDWSWIQPGISTEEWICGINLRQVPFKAGVNTATYKHYIDFASRFGLNFVMLDAGWSDTNDLFKLNPDIDLESIAAYARKKDIGLIVWTLSMTLERQLEPALDYFQKLGIKAFMTDFMDRDDQPMVQFYSRVARAAADRKLMVMFHGAYKNTGLERTWPNTIAREGALGSEYNIWSDRASPDHDVTLPFLRMITGPMDYEPGFMVNANRRTFRPLPDQVMSQGTRTHQLAMFIVYESPLQMFSGNPSDVWPESEKDYIGFIANLPTTWHDIHPIDARIGDYVVLARRHDNDWYLGALTDWEAREFNVKLDFLGPGSYRFFSCADGINAEKNAQDYQLGYQLVTRESVVTLKLAPGGGFGARIIKLDDARP